MYGSIGDVRRSHNWRGKYAGSIISESSALTDCDDVGDLGYRPKWRTINQ